jgi:ubiquinone/menaquinone biosynthesis C-methylase UbiE
MDPLARQSARDVSSVLAACLAAGDAPEIALVRLLQTQPRVAGLRRTLDHSSWAGAEALADAVRRLIDTDPEGVERAAELLADDGFGASNAGERIAGIARWFDAAVQKSEEASVAVYSLGSAQRLERATDEVVRLLGDWGVIFAEAAILQIGCGIGRFEARVAGSVRSAHGIDVSPRMIEVARRRCRGLANVRLDVCSGRDLSGFDDRSLDLVYAIDTFPYLFEAGRSVVERHFREARRVLSSHGDFVIMNFSYRGDLDADRRDVEELAKLTRFEVVQSGERSLKTWDGAGFHLRV